MRFWDSSAVVPLVVEQPVSRACRDHLRAWPTQVVWALTRTEVRSALWRRQRERLLTPEEVEQADKRLDRLAVRWTEIDALSAVRERAERLLRMHPLRAADALQLGAALLAVDGRPRHHVFVTMDRVLFEAAAREGFDGIEPKA